MFLLSWLTYPCVTMAQGEVGKGSSARDGRSDWLAALVQCSRQVPSWSRSASQAARRSNQILLVKRALHLMHLWASESPPRSIFFDPNCLQLSTRLFPRHDWSDPMISQPEIDQILLPFLLVSGLPHNPPFLIDQIRA